MELKKIEIGRQEAELLGLAMVLVGSGCEPGDAAMAIAAQAPGVSADEACRAVAHALLLTLRCLPAALRQRERAERQARGGGGAKPESKA